MPFGISITVPPAGENRTIKAAGRSFIVFEAGEYDTVEDYPFFDFVPGQTGLPLTKESIYGNPECRFDKLIIYGTAAAAGDTIRIVTVEEFLQTEIKFPSAGAENVTLFSTTVQLLQAESNREIEIFGGSSPLVSTAKAILIMEIQYKIAEQGFGSEKAGIYIHRQTANESGVELVDWDFSDAISTSTTKRYLFRPRSVGFNFEGRVFEHRVLSINNDRNPIVEEATNHLPWFYPDANESYSVTIGDTNNTSSIHDVTILVAAVSKLNNNNVLNG